MKLASVSRSAALLVALITLTVVAIAETTIPTPKLEWSGYVQGRFTDVIGKMQASPTPADTNFDVKRAYLNLRATVGDHFGATILVTGQPKTMVVEAFVDYIDNPYQARLGLSRITYGYETGLSSTKLITLERSKAISDLVYTPFLYDRGAFVYYKPAVGFNLALAIVNGNPPDVSTDPNEAKNLDGRFGYRSKGFDIGVSAYTGKLAYNTKGEKLDIPLSADRFGFDVEYINGPIVLLSELIYGEDSQLDGPTIKRQGGYVTVGYRLPKSKFMPYLRYDWYDRDLDNNISADDFSRVTMGVNCYVNTFTRLTLEYEAINDEVEFEQDGRLTAQAQVNF
jgi:hypothetical protein